MAKLRFEIWETANAKSCAAVSESWDRLRDPAARLVEAFDASTVDEAMMRHHERQGWEPYKPVPGVTDQPFTDQQAADQRAYLSVRPTQRGSG